MDVRVRSRAQSNESDAVIEDAGTGETLGEIRIDVRNALNAAEYTVFWGGDPVESGTYNFQDWNDDRRRWLLEKVLKDLNDMAAIEDPLEVQEWV